MKFTINWLKEHLDTSASLNEILEALTMAGLEVEEVHNPGQDLHAFPIVDVLEAAPHPNADRLKVLKVNTGSQTVTVVCGDPTVEVGTKGVLARPGVYVPGLDITMKVSKIRGIESHGMMCSAKELNLGEDAAGIIKLDQEAPVGTPYADYAQMDDPQIEIAITPNRGDCLGVRGIARDLAATGIGTLKPFPIEPVKGTFANPYPAEINTNEPKACPLFVSRLIKGVVNKPSPQWLQRKLEAVGVRSISALVDVTNLLAYELGRPMHVFDADKIEGTLQVRFAKEGETIKALDENTYTLKESMITIADKKKVLSIAGIMGGEDSGCTDQTTNVVIESAIFDADSIAQTGRSLNILSDSRYRFERGVDAEMVIPAMERATQLILELCGGDPSEITISGEVPKMDRQIKLNPQRVKSLGGVEVSQDRCAEILNQLGFSVEKRDEGLWVNVPSWRHDIHIEVDLVEEIMRIHGYDQIPMIPFSSLKESESVTTREEKIREKWTWTCRKILTERGLNEALTWSFLSEKQAKLFGGQPEELVIENPISTELSVMRPSLIPQLLEASQRNYDRGQQDLHLFEIGAQYKDSSPSGQVQAVSGLRLKTEPAKHWAGTPRVCDVFDVKGDVISLLTACGVDMKSVQTIEIGPDAYHPGRSAAFCLGPKNVLAYFGELHPKIQKEMDLDVGVVMFEVFLSHIPVAKRDKDKGPLEISPFQAVERDFAFVVNENTPAELLLKTAQKVDKVLIKDVRLIDVYQGEHVEQDKKSIAIGIKLQSMEKTLTDQEIQDVSDKVIHEVTSVTGGALRS